MHRKDFIKSTVMSAAAFTIVPRHVLGGTGYLAPSDRISLGFAGNGKMGLGLLGSLSRLNETIVVATSDVDQKKLNRFIEKANEANSKKVNANVTGYGHYREMLERKDIDAIVVATPDHWHAQITIDAAKAGKDIYCEKPLALTIAEGRAMANAVKKYKRVLQTGSMQRSSYNFRQATELVLNGYIGDIKEINVSVGEPVRACDLPTLPTPDYLDWDMWIGPSLYRGYNPTLSPPIEDDSWAWWRGYKGFGGGLITDWGAHMFDIVQWALGMDHSGPVSFTPPDEPGAKSGLYYTYKNGISVHHKKWGEDNAIQFIGTEGTIEVSRSFIRSNPAHIAELKLKPTDKTVYFSDNHQQDWINAIKKRSKPITDVETGHRTATVCNAVNIAYELRRPLKWNPDKELFDHPFANMMISRPYRGPWNFMDF
ncbi:MAG: Gfo/Idh/MocA family oxidoreductase [Chitinophagaceae bacterium]|nr:Gfo/Idh/MocA family oxidoreductase [Chitinophagaceae bacterium]